ncbi:hypothetical protein [Paragemmobacter ruber]|uniref:hypothetical protein n=1 Tax=Paragemmobacter ruber TaxID=1985673 RepID=UPI001F17DCD6|nr:hypothetical protein [Rhodobacter ruber]
MTPREMQVMMKGAAEGFRRDQGLTYSLAQLVGWAVNNPKEMPKFEKVFPDRKPKPAQTPDQLYAAMRAWTIHLGGTPPPKVH